MATRQYIGARYVPKFYTNSVDGSAAWESNVVYEPLTYVTLTNGHMYISKKQVPATVGTPASNAEYWLDVGSYNGFIDDLQQQINQLVTDVNAKANMVGIAPVEDGVNTIGSYSAGDEFYRNGVLYKAKTTIAANTAFSSLVLNTDYEAAPTISSEIKALSNDKLAYTDIENNLSTTIPNKVLDARQGKVLNDKISAIETFVTPQMFGAIADGVNDDTQSIQDALDYAVTNNLNLYFPKGHYIVTSSIDLEYDDITRTNLIIYGDAARGYFTDYGTTLLIDAHTLDAPLFNIKKAPNITLSGLNITGSNQRTNARGIKLTTSQGVTIENCNIDRFHIGIEASYSGICTIKNNNVTRCAIAMLFDYSGDCNITDNYINTNDSNITGDYYNTKCGIKLSHSAHCQIIGGKNEFNGCGIYIDNSAGILISNVNFDHLDNSAITIRGGECESILIDNCYFVGCGLNTFTPGSSIYATVNTRSFKVSNCDFKCTSYSDGKSSKGYLILIEQTSSQANGSQFFISNCDVFDPVSGVNQVYLSGQNNTVYMDACTFPNVVIDSPSVLKRIAYPT